jgi:hypothetical protein
MYPTFGEPLIYVPLLYCVSFSFYFRIYFYFIAPRSCFCNKEEFECRTSEYDNINLELKEEL